MKIEDYKNAMNRLTPGEDKKQQIWENITRTKTAGNFKRKKTAGISAAAAALACVFLLSGTLPAIASEVKDFFQGFFTTEQNHILDQSQYSLSGHVEKELFYDQDEHVGFSVIELLSDGMTAYATLKYTAFDETGRQWLADYADKDYFANNFGLEPAYLDRVSFGVESRLLAELCTDTEKYFYVCMEASDNEYGSEELVLRYFMSFQAQQNNIPDHGIRETKIKAVTNGMDFVKYNVKQTDGQKKDNKPVCLYVSGLSYKLYVTTKEKHFWNSPDFMNSDFMDSQYITLQFQDETHHAVRCACFGPGGKNEHNTLISGNFMDDDTWQAVTFARDEVTKLVYDGVEYDLVRED